jgi:Protein of unknown function (DUF2878)
MKLSVLNAIGFQLGWFACVLGGNVIGVIATVALLTVHGKFFIKSQREWWLIVGLGLTGLVLDSLLGVSGFLVFGVETLLTIPIWLLCLWFLFAATLCHSLAWLQTRLTIASVLGAIAAPSSYFAGSKLTTVSLGESTAITLLLIAISWAVIFPFSLYFARRCR